MNTRQLGSQAEQIAQSYLLGRGYRILALNWQYGHLEIDIIAKKDDEVVIVEVKSSYGTGFDHPLDAISGQKMRLVTEAAEAWIQNSGWDGDTRFDLITLVFTGPGEYELEHFEEAFSPEA